MLLPIGRRLPPRRWLHTDARRIFLQLRSHGAGDVVNLVPLVQELAARHPAATLFVVTNHDTLPFDRCAPNVRAVASLPSGEVVDGTSSCHLDLEPYVRYHSLCPHWLQYLLIAGVGSCSVGDEPFPLLADSNAMVARLGSHPYVLLHARNTRAEWQGRNTDGENLRRIVARLRARGLVVWQVGNDADRGGYVPHLGTLSVTELVEAVRGARAFVGVDSFPMHIAALYDKPILGFFGATYPSVVLTPVTRLLVLRNEALSCNGCVYVTRPEGYNQCHFSDERCGDLLPPDYVDAQVDRLLQLIDNPQLRSHDTSPDKWEATLRADQMLFEQTLMIDDMRASRSIGCILERLLTPERLQRVEGLWASLRGRMGRP